MVGVCGPMTFSVVIQMAGFYHHVCFCLISFFLFLFWLILDWEFFSIPFYLQCFVEAALGFTICISPLSCLPSDKVMPFHGRVLCAAVVICFMTDPDTANFAFNGLLSFKVIKMENNIYHIFNFCCSLCLCVGRALKLFGLRPPLHS